MNRENVVPFDSAARSALARRGAPDKARLRPVTIEIECPNCAAVLCLERALAATDPEILCSGCDESFFLFPGEAAAD